MEEAWMLLEGCTGFAAAAEGMKFPKLLFYLIIFI
jgi:hypothetical protein